MPKNPWYKRVQRKAAVMQSASASVAGIISTFEEWGLTELAGEVRDIAIRDGVERTAIGLHEALLRRTKMH